MADLKLRKTRTLKVTEVIVSAEETEMLAQLAMDPRYEALLNVMERACIHLDTALINVPTGEPEQILGAHAVSKAAWLFLIYVQKQVLNASYTRTPDDESTPPPNLEEVLQSLEGFTGELSGQ